MATFGIVLLILFAFVVVAILGYAGYHYVRFLKTPEAKWRTQIFKHGRQIRRKIEMLKKEIGIEQNRWMEDSKNELHEAYLQYLSAISVDNLKEYPGIGPATVEKLRQSGIANLGQLQNKRINMPGFGQKRQNDLRHAIEAQMRDASSRFEAGGCPEAEAIKLQLVDRIVNSSPRQAEVLREMSHLLEILNRLLPFIEIADRVDPARYLRHEPVPGLTPQLLAMPVEELFQSLTPDDDEAPIDPPQVVPIPNPARTNARATLTPSSTTMAIPSQSRPSEPQPTDLFRAALDKAPDTAPKNEREHPRLPHLRATTRFGVAVARVDGKIARAERETIRKYLQKAFGHERELVRWIDPSIEQSERKPAALEKCLKEAPGLFGAAELEGLYRFACEIADATGQRTPREVAGLKTIAAAWKIEPSRWDATKPVAPSSPAPAIAQPPMPTMPPSSITDDECLAALEIAAGGTMTADLIRRQYRLLTEKNDPAKFESHGTAFVSFAKMNREKIEQAAKFLLEQLGERLDEEKKPEAPKGLRDNNLLDDVFGN